MKEIKILSNDKQIYKVNDFILKGFGIILYFN